MSRTHGFQSPFHPLQLTSWFVFAFVFLLYSLLLIPILPNLLSQLLLSLSYYFLLLICVVSASISMKTDPIDSHCLDGREEGGGSGTASLNGGNGRTTGMLSKHNSAANLHHGRRNEDAYEREKRQQRRIPGRIWCPYCNEHVDASSRHCRLCDKCVLNFDHHCKWLNNCIGQKNYRSFFVCISSTFVMLLIELGVACYAFVLTFRDRNTFDQRLGVWYGGGDNQIQAYQAVIGFGIGLLLLFSTSLSQLLLLHIYLRIQKMTTYEWIIKRRQRLKMEQEEEQRRKAGKLVSKSGKGTGSEVQQIEIQQLTPNPSPSPPLPHSQVPSTNTDPHSRNNVTTTTTTTTTSRIIVIPRDSTFVPLLNTHSPAAGGRSQQQPRQTMEELEETMMETQTEGEAEVGLLGGNASNALSLIPIITAATANTIGNSVEAIANAIGVEVDTAPTIGSSSSTSKSAAPSPTPPRITRLHVASILAKQSPSTTPRLMVPTLTLAATTSTATDPSALPSPSSSQSNHNLRFVGSASASASNAGGRRSGNSTSRKTSVLHFTGTGTHTGSVDFNAGVGTGIGFAMSKNTPATTTAATATTATTSTSATAGAPRIVLPPSNRDGLPSPNPLPSLISRPHSLSRSFTMPQTLLSTNSTSGSPSPSHKQQQQQQPQHQQSQQQQQQQQQQLQPHLPSISASVLTPLPPLSPSPFPSDSPSPPLSSSIPATAVVVGKPRLLRKMSRPIVLPSLPGQMTDVNSSPSPPPPSDPLPTTPTHVPDSLFPPSFPPSFPHSSSSSISSADEVVEVSENAGGIRSLSRTLSNSLIRRGDRDVMAGTQSIPPARLQHRSRSFLTSLSAATIFVSGVQSTANFASPSTFAMEGGKGMVESNSTSTLSTFQVAGNADMSNDVTVERMEAGTK